MALWGNISIKIFLPQAPWKVCFFHVTLCAFASEDIEFLGFLLHYISFVNQCQYDKCGTRRTNDFWFVFVNNNVSSLLFLAVFHYVLWHPLYA